MRSPNISWISADDPPNSFPDIDSAFEVPDGLLAAGGDLSEARLIYAYRHGIFPWYDEGQPILWWSPNPRCILRPEKLHISRRLRRWLAHSEFDITFNGAFDAVIAACAESRSGQPGTWITPEMAAAYRHLHCQGWAHSIEVYRGDVLAGGLYGLAIGRAFFGESMFSRETNGSKTAMVCLCRVLVDNDFEIFDCQLESPHLLSLGASLVPRLQFAGELARVCREPDKFKQWPVTRCRAVEFLDRSKQCQELPKRFHAGAAGIADSD